MTELSGRRALVTGGSRSIGGAVALSLAERSADVAISYVPLTAIIRHDVSDVVEEKGTDVGDEVYSTPRIFGGSGSYRLHVR